MPAPFAALEARCNAAIVGKLANAEALCDGVTVSGIFEPQWRSDEVPIYPATALTPAFTCNAAELPDGFGRGGSVEIGDIVYEVTETRPSSGMVTLVLAR